MWDETGKSAARKPSAVVPSAGMVRAGGSCSGSDRRLSTDSWIADGMGCHNTKALGQKSPMVMATITSLEVTGRPE